jgi:EamA-like transporter family
VPSALSPHIEMLLVVLMWGGNYVASKLAIGFIPPLAFTAIRFTVGSGILWVLIRREERPRSLPTPALRPVVLLGLVGNTLYQIFGPAHLIGGILIARGSAPGNAARAPAGQAGGVAVGREGADSSSSSRAIARRRWGITMLPPTTSPTAKSSRNSSLVVPSSRQRTTW